MRTLAVLLGVSALLNVALLARRPAPAPEPPRRLAPAPSARRAEALPVEAAADVEELTLLRARVRELEGEKAARVEVVAAPDRLEAFREKLPRVLKLMKNPQALANAGPEAQLDLSEVSMEFQRAKLGRWKDPKTYTEMLRAVLEQVAVETKAPLSQYQLDALGRTLEDYEKSLAGLADKDAFERYLREVGPEADMLQRLRSFVTPEQEAKTMIFGAMSPFSASTAPWIDRGQAEAQMTQMWTAAYGLDEAQKAAVQAAARVYLNAADVLNAQLGRDAVPGRETPEWRRRTAQNLVDALGSLESSLTPEQRERLRQRRPSEVRVFDAASMRRYAR